MNPLPSLRRGLWIAAAITAVALLTPSAAEACGCLSPPAVDDQDFAVNQQSEQIIFEVNDDETITAHVHIRYAGDPSQFAWIVPVPSVPDLDISNELAIGILDQITRPQVENRSVNFCPSPLYTCQFSGDYCNNDAGNNAANNDGGGRGSMGVDVISREQVGDYDTVVFGAEESDLAVQWLQDEGFIVNDTMIPYMQPYLDAGMLFVASKLIAGAGLDSIKPLKMTYEGTEPMIPLQLTAVASEPHLTVTAYILGDSPYIPVDGELVVVNEDDLVYEGERSNYPMVLARAVDEASNPNAFAREYVGPTSGLDYFNDPSGCCSFDNDRCGIALDGLCQCPLSELDVADCEEEPELVEGYEALDDIAQRHRVISRLTTRLSPEEMTFDPMFEVDEVNEADLRSSPKIYQGRRYSLQGCTDDVIDADAHDAIEAKMPCATVYCGDGTCASTASGGGCACDDSFVAKQFTDLDGEPSVTCVPAVGTIDLSAGGFTPPDVCEGVDCGSGSCQPVGGFPTCACEDGAAAAAGPDGTPTCATIEFDAGDSGARNYSTALEDLDVCAPAIRNCGPSSHLLWTDSRGVACEGNGLEDTELLLTPEIDDAECGGSKLAEGSACEDGDPCSSGRCLDGVCRKYCNHNLDCYTGTCEELADRGWFCTAPDRTRSGTTDDTNNDTGDDNNDDGDDNNDDDNNDANNDPNAPDGNGGDTDDEDAGCAVAPDGDQPALPLLALLAAALFGLTLRRR